MRTYTEHTYLEQTTINALTHIKCDKCGKELGSFDLNNKGFYAGVKYKHTTDWPKKEYGMCVKEFGMLHTIRKKDITKSTLIYVPIVSQHSWKVSEIYVVTMMIIWRYMCIIWSNMKKN